MKFYYRNGMEILQGDIMKNIEVPSFIKVAYIEGIFPVKKEISIRLIISSQIKYVNSSNINIIEVKDGIKFSTLNLIMRKEDHENLLNKLLLRPFPEMNYEIDKKFIEIWKK